MRPREMLHNRYYIRRELGKGGMGIIYQARDQNLRGQLVAIKENRVVSKDAEEQFEREAVILAQLRHPNLPRVTNHFIEQSSGRQYLVMDYIAGSDLKDFVREYGPLPEKDVLGWMAQVMDALEYMHSRVDPTTREPSPVIHRDIKPSNIRRMSGDRIVLVDFGIAKMGQGVSTWAGARSVTDGYSPIEQYGGDTDTRSDIYSLGATLYFLLTGKTPPNAGQEIPHPRRVNPAISKNTARVIQKAMQQKASDRYQSVKEMRADLFEASWWQNLTFFPVGSTRGSGTLTGRTTTQNWTSQRTQSRDTASRTGTDPVKQGADADSEYSPEPNSQPEVSPLPTPPRTRRRNGGFLMPTLLLILISALAITTISLFMRIPMPFINSPTPTASPTVTPIITPSREVVAPIPTETASDTATATSTATPTLTSTPTVTPTVSATTTLTPSATLSPTPTIATTIESVPSSTPMDIQPTSTLFYTPTPTDTHTPTPLPTATMTHTVTPVPTNTASATATSTIRPTTTPSPIPTNTSTSEPVVFASVNTSIPSVTATSAPTPIDWSIPAQPRELSAYPGVFELKLSGPLDKVLAGEYIFSWELEGIELGENEAYEVIFWGEDGKLAYSLGDAGFTKRNWLSIDLDGAIQELEKLTPNRQYRWGIALVQMTPHKRLNYLGGGHLFRLDTSW